MDIREVENQQSWPRRSRGREEEDPKHTIIRVLVVSAHPRLHGASPLIHVTANFSDAPQYGGFGRDHNRKVSPPRFHNFVFLTRVCLHSREGRTGHAIEEGPVSSQRKITKRSEGGMYALPTTLGATVDRPADHLDRGSQMHQNTNDSNGLKNGTLECSSNFIGGITLDCSQDPGRVKGGR